MPLIEPKSKEKSVLVTATLLESEANLLERYANHVQSSRSYVVAEIIRYVLKHDREFQASLKNGAGTLVEERELFMPETNSGFVPRSSLIFGGTLIAIVLLSLLAAILDTFGVVNIRSW